MKIAESDPDPDPLVGGMDPRIRIHTKMSWIRNTAYITCIKYLLNRGLSPSVSQWISPLIYLNQPYNIDKKLPSLQIYTKPYKLFIKTRYFFNLIFTTCFHLGPTCGASSTCGTSILRCGTTRISNSSKSNEFSSSRVSWSEYIQPYTLPTPERLHGLPRAPVQLVWFQ